MEKEILDYGTAGQKKILISEEQNGMLIWLGNNPKLSKAAGQVFYNADAAKLASVAVMPQIALQDSTLLIEMYDFDAQTNQWLNKLDEAKQDIGNADCEEWLFFKMQNRQLESGKWYGFKLFCTEGQVAFSEGLHHSAQAMASMQWTAGNATERGNFHKDFHLAYMLQLVAENDQNSL